MADRQSDPGCIDPRVLTHTGSWSEQDPHNHHRGHQGTRASTGDSNGEGAYDEREGQSSTYPLPPLLPGGSAPHSTPYFNDPDDIDLEEVARQAYQGLRPSTPIASTADEPYNPSLGRPSILSSDTRVENTISHPLIDPRLSTGHVPNPITNYPQTENHSQAEVDEYVRKSFEIQAPNVSEDAAHHCHLGAHSTPDDGLGRGPAMLMSSGRHASTTTDSRVLADVGGPAIVQSGLFHQHQRVRQSDVHQLCREAAAWNNQQQVVDTPARPPLQRSSLQPAFVHDTSGSVRPHSEYGYPSANFEVSAARDDSGAGQGNRATSQHLGAWHYDNNLMTLHVAILTPSPYYRQHQPGSQESYETPQFTSDDYFRHSQPVLGHTSGGAYQVTPTDSITYSHDGSSERIPPPLRPVFSTKRSSDMSFPFTQQSAPWSLGSNEFDAGSPLATTPSQANPTKRRCPSATLRSEAVNTRVLGNLLGFAEAGAISPTINAVGVSRQTSSASSDRPFGCEEPGCPKRFKTRANLRHHADTHDPDKKTAKKCPTCGDGFRYPKDVTRHHRSQHPLEDPRVECGICGKFFSRGDNLNRHLPVCPGPSAPSAAGSR